MSEFPLSSLCYGMSQLELEDKVQTVLKRATEEISKDREIHMNRNRVLQLTDFSDPVHAHATN